MTDFADCILYDANGNELKEWYALAAYLEQFVVSGDIDMTAINAGQEVLVVAPTIYAFLSPDGAVNSSRATK